MIDATDQRSDPLGRRLAEVSHEVRHAANLRFDSLDHRLDLLSRRLAEVSHEVRHAADLRFDSVDHRIAAVVERLDRLEAGLGLMRESLAEATVYMTRAIREACPPDAD